MKVILTLLLAAFSFLLPLETFAQNPTKVAETKAQVRDLWVGHIFWVRSVVIAHSEKNATYEKSAENAAVENAKQIAAIVEPFYGAEAREGLFNLLAGHYGAIKAYMNASFPQPDVAAQNKASTELTKNAGAIADFLSGANPYLPRDVLFSMLAAHGGHHIIEIGQIQKKDYDGDAKTWDMMREHIYKISDALVDGIAKQFPDKFN